MRWAGYVERMGEDSKMYRLFLWESQKERDHLEVHGVDGVIGSES
jgi:hypothetical protein